MFLEVHAAKSLRRVILSASGRGLPGTNARSGVSVAIEEYKGAGVAAKGYASGGVVVFGNVSLVLPQSSLTIRDVVFFVFLTFLNCSSCCSCCEKVVSLLPVSASTFRFSSIV